MFLSNFFYFVSYFLWSITRVFNVIEQVVPGDEYRIKVEAAYLMEELLDVMNLCSGQAENVKVGESQFSALAIGNQQNSSL